MLEQTTSIIHRYRTAYQPHQILSLSLPPRWSLKSIFSLYKSGPTFTPLATHERRSQWSTGGERDSQTRIFHGPLPSAVFQWPILSSSSFYPFLSKLAPIFFFSLFIVCPLPDFTFSLSSFTLSYSALLTGSPVTLIFSFFLFVSLEKLSIQTPFSNFLEDKWNKETLFI